MWIYDPTKGEKARGYIPHLLRHRAHFGKLALSASDRHGPSDDPKAWSLKSLMAENGASLSLLRFRRRIAASPPPRSRPRAGARSKGNEALSARQRLLVS